MGSQVEWSGWITGGEVKLNAMSRCEVKSNAMDRWGVVSNATGRLEVK